MADLAIWFIMVALVFSVCPNLRRIAIALEKPAPPEPKEARDE